MCAIISGTHNLHTEVVFSLSQKRLHLIPLLTLYKIHNWTEKVGQTNASLLNTQAQMHTLSCSEDTAQEPLHLHTRVFSHRVGEILWFTELRTRPQDQQRTGTSGHSADFICLYTFEGFGLAPSSCCCLSGRTLYPAKHQQGFVIYPHQCKVRTWSLKLYLGKSIFCSSSTCVWKINTKKRVYLYTLEWKIDF